MITTFKAKAKKMAEGLTVETEARNFKIIYDEPEDMGGTDKGLNPVEALLATFGACQSIVASAFADANDFSFEEFWIDLEGDIDLDGFMGISDVRKGFQEIRYTVHFKTNESQEKAEAFADFIEDTCPIGDCLANPVKLVRAGVVIE